MKKSMQKLYAVLLAAVLICSSMTVGFYVSAEDESTLENTQSDNSFECFIDYVEPDGDFDPSLNPTNDELAALDQAISELVDPENLLYYKDEAILRVAKALASPHDDPQAFLADAVANGYRYQGKKSDYAVRNATAALKRLMGDSQDAYSLKYVDPNAEDQLLYWRDESRAHLDVRVDPIAINGVTITGNANGIPAHAGDRITFALRMQSDYYVSAGDFPIVFDATKFYIVGHDGDRYGFDPKSDARDAKDLIASDAVDASGTGIPNGLYTIEPFTVNSPLGQYPSAYQTAEYMSQYKVILVEMLPVVQPNAKLMKFPEMTDVCTFTLEVRADTQFGEQERTSVGVLQDWYATKEARCNLFAVTRAAGMKSDGQTPATAGTSARYSFEVFDRDAQYGQTVQTVAAVVHLESKKCVHTFALYDEKAPTETEDGYKTYRCTKCGETYTDVIPLTGALLELQASRAVPGMTMEVTVNVRNNPGIVATHIWLEYDPRVLTLEHVFNGKIFGDEAATIGGDLNAIPYNVLWMDPLAKENHAQDGTLLTLVFRVSPEAVSGDTPVRLFYDLSSTFDVDLNEKPFCVRSTNVTILRIRGDADMDGILSTKDIVVINRALVEQGPQPKDMPFADYNGDGKINLKDSTCIARHLAGGWDC